MGMFVFILVIVVRGVEEGLVVGLIVVVYGNEFNGILVIQCFFWEIDVWEIKGIIVGVFVVNLLSLLCKKWCFIDGIDFNYIMLGWEDGNVSQVYVYCIVNWIVVKFDYFIDLYIVSFGWVNFYYIWVDMSSEIICCMVLL